MMVKMSKLFGSIEAGGTKFVCAVGNEAFMILESTTFPTEEPVKTLQQAVDRLYRFRLVALDRLILMKHQKLMDL